MEWQESSLESMPEMRILLVMEMRDGTIYSMWEIAGGFSHGNIFGKLINLQGVCGRFIFVFT